MKSFKIKKEYPILLIIICGLGAYLYLHNSDSTHYEIPTLTSVVKKDISKIEIATTDKNIVLNREDNKWKIAPQGYLADSDKVQSMLDIISDLTLTTMVSETQNYQRYDLDNDKKIKVKAWSGDIVVRDMDIGKTAPSYRHTYVRLSDNTNVYHAQENFRSRFEQSLEELRDKHVLSFNTADIQEVQIAKGADQNLLFNRKQAPVEVKATDTSAGDNKGKTDAKPQEPPPMVWQDATGKPANENQINALLNILSTLSCDSYIVDKTKNDIQKNKPTHTYTLKGAKTYVLSIFEKLTESDQSYPAVTSENDYPFLLSISKFNDMASKIDELSGKKEEAKAEDVPKADIPKLPDQSIQEPKQQ
ncbi:MAG: DUF4340 domain-containing protein [Desulfobacterales bacterium]|nr:DUF4340 domain-containing protein [Desulfobacterales bacterium]